MSFYKFNSSDILHNRIKSYPRIRFDIHTGSIYYNENVGLNGVPDGNISLQELTNLPGESGNGYYAFVTKDSGLAAFNTVSPATFSALDYGDMITSSLPQTSSIAIEYHQADDARLHIDALRNVSNYYTYLSDNYTFSSSLGDKATQSLTLVSVPSIFYGSSIKKGSVDLKFNITGTMVGQLKDENQDGNLIQVGPEGSTGSGSVAGVVYYNEGFLLLTGSWAITSESQDYYDAALDYPRWKYFGRPGLYVTPFTDAIDTTYSAEFKGTNYVPVVTMLAHAEKAHLNQSNNPTFTEFGQNPGLSTGSDGFYERVDLSIKNVAKYPYNEDTGSFKKETYISKIGIYDKDRNLIGIAKVATPVRKRENDKFTFKMKMDY